MSKKQYDVSSILRRADQLGMVLYIEGAELKVLAPSGLPQLKKALDVIKEHKAAIIAHLRGLEACALCVTCMDEGRETEATRELDGFMYCQAHWKAPEPTEAQRAQASLESLLSRAQAMADAIGGAELNVHPASYTLQEHMEVLRQERQAQLEARMKANRQRAKVRVG